MPDTAILDVDGTLVDSNYQHALAWYRAFRRFGTTLPIWHLHRAVGMGGDQLVTHVAGEQAESDFGDDVRAAHGEEFDGLIGEVAAFGDAERLLSGLREDGMRLVLATSGSSDTAEHLLGLVDGRSYAHDVVTSSDVEASKPAPDLVELALDRAGDRDAVLIGDSVWDGQAGVRAGVPFLAVRTGGFSDDELTEAGARHVVESLSDLLDHLRGHGRSAA
jgi:HAD superfamily hydrolase (TIGR01549 family)